MQPLTAIVYVSSAVTLLDNDALVELLRVARARNEDAGVTGLLLHADGNFLQYLEGEHDRLMPIWASIERDPRHHRINVLLDGPTAQREFEGWSMAYGSTDLPGFLSLSLSDWSNHGRGVAANKEPDLTPGRALIRAMWTAMHPGLRGTGL